MYHEKMGILEDKDGNHVAFSGSMNESMTAMSINYETIDVFCDWKEAEADRVKLKENAFYSMWNNVEPSLKVWNSLRFPMYSLRNIGRKLLILILIMNSLKKESLLMEPCCVRGALYGGR